MRAAHWLTYWGLPRWRDTELDGSGGDYLPSALYFVRQRGQTESVSLTPFSLCERSCEAKLASNINDRT